MILSKVDQCLPVPALHHTDVVREASLHPLVKAGNQVQGGADLHEAIVAQEVSLGLQGGALEDDHVVSVLHDPQAEHGHLHADLDGGVQTARLLVVEVPSEAGAEGAADWLTELYWSHPAVPESERGAVVLQPVGEVDSPAPHQLPHQAAQGAVHVPLAGDGESLRGEPGEGEVRPLAQSCWPGQLNSQSVNTEVRLITMLWEVELGENLLRYK